MRLPDASRLQTTRERCLTTCPNSLSILAAVHKVAIAVDAKPLTKGRQSRIRAGHLNLHLNAGELRRGALGGQAFLQGAKGQDRRPAPYLMAKRHLPHYYHS